LYIPNNLKLINNYRKERFLNSSTNETSNDEQPGTSKQLKNTNTTVYTQQNETKANSGKTPKWFKPV